jgi:hypothetical protein
LGHGIKSRYMLCGSFCRYLMEELVEHRMDRMV